jgi:hypothetical protein
VTISDPPERPRHEAAATLGQLSTSELMEFLVRFARQMSSFGSMWAQSSDEHDVRRVSAANAAVHAALQVRGMIEMEASARPGAHTLAEQLLSDPDEAARRARRISFDAARPRPVPEAETLDEPDDRPRPLALKGPHGRFTIQAIPFGPGAAWVVMSAECGGFRGSASFHVLATSVRDFLLGLGKLRSGDESVEACLAAEHYTDCRVVVRSEGSTLRIEGNLGATVGLGSGAMHRHAVFFGFYFERCELDALDTHGWVREVIAHANEEPGADA